MTGSICSRRPGSTAARTISAALSTARTRSASRVILDVVYNHFGPDGNYLELLLAILLHRSLRERMGRGDQFRRSRRRPGARVLSRQCRLLDRRVSSRRAAARRDAADLRRLGRPHHGRDRAPGARGGGAAGPPLSSARTSRRHASLVRPPERGGYGLDALWNDDFHHSAMVALTGRHEAYYTDYRGAPARVRRRRQIRLSLSGPALRLAEASGAARRRSTCRPRRFVVFLQNHDQIANSAPGGCAVHALTSPGRLRAMTAYFLLMPGIPMLFQGQEFAASTPFLYFADHRDDLVECRAQGPRRVPRAISRASPTRRCRRVSPIPATRRHFRRVVLDLGERERHAPAYALHRDLLALRRDDPVLGRRPARVDGAVLGDAAWMLRFFADDTPRTATAC